MKKVLIIRYCAYGDAIHFSFLPRLLKGQGFDVVDLETNFKGFQLLESNPFIDKIYNAAREGGALGGKILGAGGGGFLLLYCEDEHQEGVRDALFDLKETKFELELQGSKIMYVSD